MESLKKYVCENIKFTVLKCQSMFTSRADKHCKCQDFEHQHGKGIAVFLIKSVIEFLDAEMNNDVLPSLKSLVPFYANKSTKLTTLLFSVSGLKILND